ncbi:VanZ family protein [Cytobacillus firmus]|uniref:VanZ family protein n=1 Tax=Cytobacillus firmus TaxID=1399 RepID=UPI0024C1EAFE|nr:VanZ family protein [Cytobacillus firmus]WHY61110.1 VanZ family protein [Cytobacillus firmus]
MVIIRCFLLILPFLYMGFIWLQSSHFNLESVSALSSLLDMRVILLIGILLELAHFFEFGLFYLLLIMSFLTLGKLNNTKEILAASLALAYGLIDEIHQIYVPFRSFSYFDLFKNCIGVWVVSYIVHRCYFIRKNSRFGAVLRKITKQDKNKAAF